MLISVNSNPLNLALPALAAELEPSTTQFLWISDLYGFMVALNADPSLPFPDASIDDATCCVSVDYLTEPVKVFRDVARVLRPGGRFVVAFSNRCFPTKAIRGWLATDDTQHVQIVEAYFALSGGFGSASSERRTDPGRGDPLYGVWAVSSMDDGAANVS
jgi:SAM-dependent methyltransferase